jgi:gas vesicle protein
MNRTTERNIWVFAAGLVAGAAVGATMALLLAPKRGADLRNDLSRSAAKLGKTVTDKATKAAEAASSVLERARPHVGNTRGARSRGAREMADDSADLYARSRDMVAEGGS